MSAVLAAAVAWAAFLPIGIKYLAFLGCGAAALVRLQREQRFGELLRDPGFRAAAAFWGLTVLSLLWTTAGWHDSGPQLWLYGLLLLVAPIALACPPAWAWRVLRQFTIAAGVIGAATALWRIGLLPDSVLWRFVVDAQGNQRIINSLMLAVGAALAMLLALQALSATRAEKDRGTHWRAAAGWTIAAAFAVLGLALQDRRTGMVALPVLLAMLGLARQRNWPRRLLSVAVVAGLSLAAWQFSPAVHGRIDEGLNELRHYQSSDTADTSWGMRLRLAEHTLDMVREKPLLGHGVGAWLEQWRARVQPGLLISVHLTPHDEYLLVASQLGLAGVALLLWLLVGQAVRAWRAGPDGQAALLAWTAIAWTAIFNVVLRDAKFALPLLLVAGVAGAASRRHARLS